jgi:hypothetical protein
MASGWLRSIVWIWSVACVVMAAGAFADVPPIRPMGLVLELHGELDHASQIEDIRRGVAKAKADGAQVIAIEIRGRAWRYDIARSLAEFVASSEPPVAVYIADGALGVAIAGAPANAGCWATEGLTLERDDDAIEYADNAKQIRDDAKAWAKSDGWSVLTKHPALRAAVLDPRKSCWLIEAKSGEIATIDEEPDALTRQAAARVLRVNLERSGRLRIPLNDAVSLGLLSGRVRNATEALQAAAERLGLKNLDIREPREIGTTLSRLRDQVTVHVEQTTALLDQAEKALVVDRDGVVSGPAVKNFAGTSALAIISTAKFELEQAKTLLQATPEIQHLPSPGQSGLVTKGAMFASRWRGTIEGLHKRAAKLEKQATEFRDAK